MKRNPQLAHQITLEHDVKRLRGTAIDSLTSLTIAAQSLARNNEKMDSVKELEAEEKVYSLMQEAQYDFYQYLKYKKARYEDKLHIKEEGQFRTIEKGNCQIVRHSNDLDELKQERGI